MVTVRGKAIPLKVVFFIVLKVHKLPLLHNVVSKTCTKLFLYKTTYSTSV